MMQAHNFVCDDIMTQVIILVSQWLTTDIFNLVLIIYLNIVSHSEWMAIIYMLQTTWNLL